MLSHMRAITWIKDPIHDSIGINIFEREIVDSPYFQRLHFVLQNSMTYVGFPSNKNSRFAHSLGVSFVAGRLFSSALNHSSSRDADRFLREAALYMKNVTSFLGSNSSFDPDEDTGATSLNVTASLISAWRKTISGAAGFAHSSFLPDTSTYSLDSATKISGFPVEFVVDTLWQAVKIHGLIHDVGHLPMSHSFEDAIEMVDDIFKIYNKTGTQANDDGGDRSGEALRLFESHIRLMKERFFGREKDDYIHKYKEVFSQLLKCSQQRLDSIIADKLTKIHEIRSYTIFNILFSGDGDRLLYADYDVVVYRRFIWHIVVSILLSRAVRPQTEDAAKHKLLIRDEPHFLRMLRSIVDGEVDADRLDYTLRDGMSSGTTLGMFDLSDVLNNAILIQDEGFYRVAFYKRAISSIEQFYNERHESHKYIIQHRTSSRTELCLQDLLARIIHFSYLFPDTIIADLMTYYGYLARDAEKNIEAILPVDDLNLSRVDDANLRTLFFEMYRKLKDPSPDEINLCTNEPYKEFAQMIRDLIAIVIFRDYQHIFDPFKHERIRDRLVSLEAPGNYTWEKFRDKSNAIIGNSESYRISQLDFRQQIIQSHSSMLNCITHVIKPKIFKIYSGKLEKKTVKIVLEYEKYVDAGEYSEFLRNMSGIEEQEMHIRVYFVANDIKYNEKLMGICQQIVNNFLLKFWRG